MIREVLSGAGMEIRRIDVLAYDSIMVNAVIVMPFESGSRQQPATF